MLKASEVVKITRKINKQKAQIEAVIYETAHDGKYSCDVVLEPLENEADDSWAKLVKWLWNFDFVVVELAKNVSTNSQLEHAGQPINICWDVDQPATCSEDTSIRTPFARVNTGSPTLNPMVMP